MRHSVLSRKKPLTDDFHLKVCNALAFAFLTMPLKDDDVVNVAVKDLSTQCKFFLDIVSQLLCGLLDQRELISPLTSISGDLLLSNLLTSSTHSTCKNPRCHEMVWKLQATPLVVSVSEPNLLYSQLQPGSPVQLTPCCLLPLFASWSQSASQAKLKSIDLQTPYEEGKFKMLSSITQTLTFFHDNLPSSIDTISYTYS